MVSLVSKFRTDIVPRLLKKYGVSVTLTTYTRFPDPTSGTVTTIPATTTLKAIPLFGREKLEEGGMGHTQMARTIVAAKDLTAPPPLAAKLTIGLEDWVIARVDPLPDDGSATGSAVAAYKLTLER